MIIRCLRRFSEFAIFGEVGAHVTLKVEVGKFVRFLNLEELAEFRVRDDAAAVFGSWSEC